MSEARQKLIEIQNLKKYFPVKRKRLFQEKQYVHAVESVSFSIYKGETLGIVGESGCGKSTLGRVLLQLYSQTGGSSVYYGSTLDDIVPRYVTNTILNHDLYRWRLRKAASRVRLLETRAKETGGTEKADPVLLQKLSVARYDEQTRLNNIVKVLGGFYACPDEEGLSLLQKRYAVCRLRRDAVAAEARLRKDIGYFDREAEDAKSRPGWQRYRLTRRLWNIFPIGGPGKVARLARKADRRRYALDLTRAEICRLNDQIASMDSRLAEIKSRYSEDPEFARYEAMRDDGIDMSRLKQREMRTLRKELQIIFQDPFASLDPRMTVGEIVGEALDIHQVCKGKTMRRERINHLLDEVGLNTEHANRFPHEFSGGQQQRIGIARALAVRPKFIVCDEPISALDVSIQSQIINLLQELKEKEQLTYLFISHDLSVVKFISDRIAVMYLGSLVELADSNEVCDHPIHPYTQTLLSAVPLPDPEKNRTRRRILLEGDIPSPINPPTGCRFHTRCPYATERCAETEPVLKEYGPGHYAACHLLDDQKSAE